MSPSVDVRNRANLASEIKFLVDPATAAQIRSWSRDRLINDPNAAQFAGDTYHITSLYLDSDRFEVFHRLGSFAHSKYRLRRYDGGDSAFLERKLKLHGLIAKHRTVVPLAEISLLNGATPDPLWAGRWFHRRVVARQLKPVCQIDYRRMARVQMTPSGPIRLTLDDAIRARISTDCRFHDPTEAGLPLGDRLVLELKYRRDVPPLFKELIERFSLNPHPFSKYRTAVAALGLVPTAAAPEQSEEPRLCQTS